jgi:hypothetical protein
MIVGSLTVAKRVEEVCLTTHIRCPGCHLRMQTAPQLRAEQAELAWRRRQSETGSAFVNWTTPESDTRSFPCRRCGTRIEHGKLVEGAYAEGVSGALCLELPAIGAVTAWLVGWILGWGVAAAAIAAVVAIATSAGTLFHLHHAALENRQLRTRGLEPIPLGIRRLILQVSGLLSVVIVGTVIYRSLGALSLVAAFVVTVVALIAVQARSNRRRQKEHWTDIAERNRRQVERVSR